MKYIYKNIKIPYSTYLKKYNKNVYIYNNKIYLKPSELYKDYLNSYLIYHFTVNNELKEVSDFDDILYYILNNFNSFDIPKKYIYEYSKREYDFLMHFKNFLLNDSIKLEKNNLKFNLKYLFRYKFDYLKKYFIYVKYKKVVIPQKVVVKNNVYYAFDGNLYSNMQSIVESMILDNLYFPYSSFKHHHDFKSLILSIYMDFDIFNLNKEEKKYYSKQELNFINLLIDKLKKDKFNYLPYKNYFEFNENSYKEYNDLKHNKKYFSLFIFNIKYYYKIRKLKNNIIKVNK